ncbi:uncharacterized protein LOC114848854 isoform X2 [Betta splendens]|uniref:Uncharacterized protein LOC114848854 isoform X2 n=1 Tax=Betta splendens TaxID=158456 RepID=A0A6P7LL92_BETSP|nr:uncharacterized protein LOC114848854 isoform X2 [Betta splendens]
MCVWTCDLCSVFAKGSSHFSFGSGTRSCASSILTWAPVRTRDSSTETMLLTFSLLLFMWSDTGKSTTPTTTQPSRAAIAFTEPVSPSCVLVATPDYPVAAGQTVHLRCSSEPPSSSSSSFIWQRLQNQTWASVGYGAALTLTAAEQSGLYRCCAGNRTQSQNHTVFIVAAPPAADGYVGVAALVLSLIALGVSGAAVFWMGTQKCDVALPKADATKDFPLPKTAPKVTVTEPGDDGDVYMNYSNSSHAYTDLDPAKMAVSSVYSTLS